MQLRVYNIESFGWDSNWKCVGTLCKFRDNQHENKLQPQIWSFEIAVYLTEFVFPLSSLAPSPAPFLYSIVHDLYEVRTHFWVYIPLSWYKVYTRKPSSVPPLSLLSPSLPLSLSPSRPLSPSLCSLSNRSTCQMTTQPPLRLTPPTV